MSNVVAVVCPKCAKRQELGAGVVIPPHGLRHLCSSCSAVFLVRAPRQVTPPPQPAVSAPESRPILRPLTPVPVPTRGQGLSSLFEPAEGSLGSDLPAPREDVPRPDDLLAAREDVPRPDDLLAAREDVPRPDDLLAAREDVPRPDDLLAARENVPRPSSRGGRGSHDPGLEIGGLGLAPLASSPAPGVPSAGTMDIFLGDLPSASESPLAPLDLDIAPPSQKGAAPIGLDFALDGPASAGGLFAPLPGLDLAPTAAPSTGAPITDGLPLDLLDLQIAPPSGAGPPPAAAPSNPAAEGDFAFSLELDQGAPAAEGAAPDQAAPAPAAGAAATAAVEQAGARRLAPPRAKLSARGAAAPATPSRTRRPLVLLGAAVGIAAALGAAAWLVLPRFLGGGPAPAALLAPFVAPLGRDHYPTYQRAADALLASVTEQSGPAPRAAAAELLLIAGLAHDEKAKVTRAEQVLAELASAQAGPELGRARALLAVGKNRGREVDGHLGADTQSPEAQLVVGLRRLREGKPEQAVPALRGFTQAAPERLVGQFLLGRALEDSRQPAEAVAAYRKVIAGNADHPGAQLALLRLGADPPDKVLAAVKALVPKIASAGAPGDVADADALYGRAALALGRNSEAAAALGRAVAAKPDNVAANVALGEALLAEGRGRDALTKLKAAGPALAMTAAGRLAIGGALISTGLVAEGLALVRAAAAETPKDPRVPYWMGVAAASQRPPDDDGAAEGFRNALQVDPRFLPATLRLGALLQRRGHADQALATLKQAEAAGAAPEALEIAWGEALVAAKNAGEGERVFRKALARSPKLAAAHTGLAVALEAQGKLGEAEAALQAAVTAMPDATGLREPLAILLVKLGKKAAALAALEAEIATGKAPTLLRVSAGRLALELGQHEIARKQLEAAVQEQPGTPEALFTLGQTREAAGDREGALREYRRALAFESTPHLHLSLGRALLRLGKEDEAIGHFDSAGAIAPARLERARLRLKRGQIEQALADADEATRLAPGDGEAHLLKGLCLDQIGRANDAAESWRTAVRVRGDLAEAHYRLGRYELDLGRAKIALPRLRQATARPPEGAAWVADLYFQLGTAELAAGSRGSAAAAFKKYLEVAPPEAPARPEAEKHVARLGRR